MSAKFQILILIDEECGHRFQVRRPARAAKLIPGIARYARCPLCNPEHLKECCGGCRIPFTVVPMHSRGLCGTCVVQDFRTRKSLQPITL